MNFPKRTNIPESATFKYEALSKKPGVINLTVGRPDFDTPTAIKEAAKRALDEGKVHYTPTKGIPELREKISGKLLSENKIEGIDPEKVIVSAGGKQILFEIMLALVERGDTVALPDPCWVSYPSMVKLADGNVKWLAAKPESGFIPDDDFFNDLENSKATLLVLNSPSNPTGAVYPKRIIEKIIDICDSNGTWIISDEMYEKFIYEGQHFSPASVYDKTITVNGFSKEFSMTGWRLGYAACRDAEVIKKINLVQGQSVSCPTSFAQYGALAAYSAEVRKDVDAMISEFKKRRDYVMKRMSKIDAVCVKPAGAFYVFPHFGRDDVELADKLIEGGVGSVPGSAFGDCGKGCIRLSYGSANIKTLGEAFDRIEKVI
ncbi:MAG: hypothetical protein MSIBF_07270 [Candidatus Altiarchaeales archaeon IMC4]|nr:MAG: hypothetical protein MSIBF_07270 [Candidatus Altiarchaeales archaeon IMC4]